MSYFYPLRVLLEATPILPKSLCNGFQYWCNKYLESGQSRICAGLSYIYIYMQVFPLSQKASFESFIDLTIRPKVAHPGTAYLAGHLVSIVLFL